MLKSVLSAIDVTSDWSGKIVSFLIYVGIGMLVYEVVLRYLFNAPTIWAHSMTQRLFAVYYVLLGAYTLRQGAHVRIDAIYNKFSVRTRAILDMVTSVLFFLFCGLLLWKGIDFAMTSIEQREKDNSVFNAPIYHVKIMLPVGALLIILQGLANFIRNFATAVTGRQYEH
jgi:TRAP-type mannitol/chloroaromatic compound transport system permease small subunit